MRTDFPYVRICTLNYDGGDITLRCIRSLENLNYPRNRYEICVVDNASIDGLHWKIPRLFPDTKLIQSLSNEGFARGNNLAMADLRDIDVVCLINNDAWADPNWLGDLVAELQSSANVGAACSKMLFASEVVGVEIDPQGAPVCLSNVLVDNKDSLSRCRFDERFDKSGIGRGSPTPQYWITRPASVWVQIEASDTMPVAFTVELSSPVEHEIVIRTVECEGRVLVGPNSKSFTYQATEKARVVNNAGSGLFTGWSGGDIGFRELDLGQYDLPSEPFGFCGGAVALRTEFLRDVGLFDPTYFLYYEDLDLSWRGRLHGWTYRYVPTSIVYHEHAYSSVEGSAFFNFWVDRNRRLTLVKNAPIRVAVKAIAGSVVWGLRDTLMPILRAVGHGRRPPWRTSAYRFRQMLSLLKGLPSALRERRRLRKVAKVPRSFVSDWIIDR